MPLSEKIAGYEILETLGQGPVGKVYKARRNAQGPVVALKVLIAGQGLPKEFLDRCLREARSAAAIGHPGIVRLLDAGVEGSVHYVATEWVETGSLATLLARGPLEPEEARRIGIEAADALQAAHEHGLVHRNLKPSNILLDVQSRPRIADFGMGLAPEEDERGGSGDLPIHRSPEQVFGSPEEVTARTDVYSLGSVLYEALTGRPPFEGPDLFSLLKRLELEEPAAPSARRPGIPKALDGAILRTLEKDPARRTVSAKEFAHALRRRGGWIGRLAGVAALAIVAFALFRWTAGGSDGKVRAEVLHRLYSHFLRHGVIEGNTRIPYLVAAAPLDLDRDVAELKRLGASASELALAESIRHSFAARFREAEERARDCGDPRAAVLRRNALLQLSAPPPETPPNGWAETLLAAVAAARAGRESEALQLAGALKEPLARAVVLENLGRFEQAQAALQAARAADPDDPFPVCYSLSVKLSCQNDLEADPGRLSGEFLGAAVPLVSKGSANPAPYVLLAVAHLIQGNRPLGEESLAAARARLRPRTLPAEGRPDRLSAFLAPFGLSGGLNGPAK